MTLPAGGEGVLAVRLVLPAKAGLTEEDRSYIDSSLIECYGRFGINFDNASLSDDLQPAAVYAATGFATDVIVQNGDVGTALLSDELWKLLGTNSSPLAADYTMQMVKLIRSQGGIAGVTSQSMADMMAQPG